jgi:uncharacterized protein (TIGR03435 family)
MAKPRATIFCITLFALVCSTLCPIELQAQAPVASMPQFEVASVKEVKQSNSDTSASGINSRLPDRFVATNVPVFFLILEAYEITGHNLVGAPDWTWDKAYDLVGTYPGASRPPNHEIHLMLQQLLGDRFGLKAHREQREILAYDLVVARKDGKLGPHIHKSDMDCAAWIASGRPKTAPGPPSPVLPSVERPVCGMLTTRKWLTGGARTMQDLAGPLGALSEKTVVDKTGLTGSYDIDLQWASMELSADQAGSGASNGGPSLFTALEEQLGLKLVPHKEQFDVVVVDAIKPASPN